MARLESDEKNSGKGHKMIWESKKIYVVGVFIMFGMVHLINNNVAAANFSLSVSGPATLDIHPTITGSFAKSDNITVSASTDDARGYRLIIQAANSTNLVNSSEDAIESLDSGTSISEATFAAGNYNGRWGYIPSMFNSEANFDFRPSPSVGFGDIINKTTCANGTANCPNSADMYTIAVGAKVDTSQPVGEYENTFNIILISSEVDYSITYRNGTVMNMPEDENSDTEADMVTISENIPVREGYNFLGWCTVIPARDGSCSGTEYSAGDSYQLDGNSDNELALYARWESTIATATYMQDVNSCPDTLTTGQQYTLIDKRDGKEYTVAKQADGKCWMTQNLDLEIGGVDTAPLTSNNTNLNVAGSEAYADGYGTVNGINIWNPVATAITSSYTISGATVSPAWPTNNRSNPYSAEGGDVYVYTSDSTSGDTVFTSLSDCMTTGGHTEAECAHYHVGNYYNWTAAIASNDSSNYWSGYAVNDICPVGWRLPKGRAATDNASTREFGELFRAAGITDSLTANRYTTNGFNNIRIAPLYFVRGGLIGGSSLSSRGSLGFYWSSTVYNGNYAYYAEFSSVYVNSAVSENTRDLGFSIRCVAQ